MMIRFGLIRNSILSPLKRAFSQGSAEKVCKIGCASGFWGDTAVASPQLIHKGGIDFLVFDYLSEITMSLLAAAKAKNPALGYTQDFVDVAVGPYIQQIKDKGIRVVANSGGINPHGCAEALSKVASKAGIDLDIAVVTGDDLMAARSTLGACLDMDNSQPLPSKNVTSLNAYLGAYPISRALDMGAQVVITGRCVDSAVTLGPLIHTFKWKPTDHDLLAGGSLAGHLIECGAQATGGIFTDHHNVPDWWNIGFPIAECSANGDCVITKPKATGGLVTRAIICEQLVYEIGDPTSYILPDVICDFSGVTVTQQADNRVFVTGARGKAQPNMYKVSGTYLDGYRITAVANVLGGDAVAKGRRTGEAILKRVRHVLKQLDLKDFTRTHLQILGGEETFSPQFRSKFPPREAMIWLAAEHEDKKALGLLAREIAPAGTGMAPGLTGIAGGRPKISPKLKLHSFLVDKSSVEVTVTMGSQTSTVPADCNSPVTDPPQSPPPTTQSVPLETGTTTYRLVDLAWARSGDKGNTCNVGVVARSEAVWPYLKAHLTTNKVGEFLSESFSEQNFAGKVDRYEMEGIQAVNFVLRESLGGGGIASLRPDPQGKGIAQMLLDLTLTGLPEGLEE